jgi:competence protein ComEC
VLACGHRSCSPPAIGGYFILPAEPEIRWGSVVLLVAGIGGIGLRKRRGKIFFGLLVVMIADAGFAAAQFCNASVSAPALERRIGPVSLSGRVIRVEPSEKGYRLTLDRREIDRPGVEEMPVRPRISVRSRTAPPNPGVIITARAILQPPPSPSLPGGYDFARKASFERIGAVGFTLGAVTVTGTPAPSSWRIWLARLRLGITKRIVAGVGAQEEIGPVASALTTGERQVIRKESLASMRNSGLAHLLLFPGFISGLWPGYWFSRYALPWC